MSSFNLMYSMVEKLQIMHPTLSLSVVLFDVSVSCYQCISSQYGSVPNAPHLSPQAGCGDPFSPSQIERCNGQYCVVGIYHSQLVLFG